MSFPLPVEPSFEEKMKELDSVPLFMRSLPGPDEHTDDVAISALQSLAFDGTPDEIAQSFKEQGNDYYKGKRYRDALGFYGQGIDAKPDDQKLLEVMLCNRAACNLELQNYGSVLRDCGKAISLNQECSKAYYRSAQALMALDRTEDALDACQRCLSFDSDNAGLRALHERVVKAKALKEEKERTRLNRLKKEAMEKKRLQKAFEERSLIDIPQPSGSSDSNHKPYFDGDDAAAALIFPSFFLYPHHAQSDIVPNFHEDTTFRDQLSAMFPPNAPAPNWDSKNEYIIGKIAVYAITHTKRLLKVGMKMTLRDVFDVAKSKDGKRDGLEVREGYLNFVIVPKGEIEQGWVDEFKSSRNRAV